MDISNNSNPNSTPNPPMPAQRQKNTAGGVKRSAEPPPIRELEFTMSSKRQLSCAECRRLKRRCDRQWPCKSCISRGCASICPDGTLTQGVGGRFILSGSEQLHKKIREMGDRIKELEDALAATWSPRNGDTGDHPLLRKDLLRIKLPPDVQSAELSASTTAPDATMLPADPNDGSEWRMSYMGRTAKIEYLLRDENSSQNPTRSAADAYPEPRLPDEIVNIAQSFFISVPEDCSIDFSYLLTFLPDRERGTQLTHYYFDRCGWFYQPMEKHEFVADIFNGIYNLAGEHSTDGASSNGQTNPKTDPYLSDPQRVYGAIDLALLFMILSGGANVDTALPANNEEVRDYHSLAKVALSLEKPWDSCSILFVQTLHLMVYNSIIWEQENAALEYIWGLMGLVTKMTLTLGLHRDSAKWGLSEAEVNKRRRVFWDVRSMETWQTLGYGRPPTLHAPYIDCNKPQTDETRDSAGNLTSQSYAGQLFRFVEECLTPITEHTFSVSTTSTNPSPAITELDEKVKDFKVLEVTRNHQGPPSLGWKAQTHLMTCAKNYAQMYIHRGHFARAIKTNPDSPLESQYSESVMVTIRSASALLQDAQAIYNVNREVMGRFGLLWTYALKIAVPMTILCERSPRGALAPHAYDQLHATAEFIYSAQNHHPRMAQLKATLSKLQQNAHTAISAVGPGLSNQLSFGNVSMSPDPPESEETSAYSGTSRIVHVADRKNSPQTARSRNNTESPKEASEQLYMKGQETVHPVSSMRGAPSGYNTHPSMSTHQYMVGSQNQEQNPPESYAHSQQPTDQHPYYSENYHPTPAPYSQHQGYQAQVPPYVIDNSGSSAGIAPGMAQYGANSAQYNNVGPASSGMMNAAMREYDLTWLDRFEPSTSYRPR